MSINSLFNVYLSLCEYTWNSGGGKIFVAPPAIPGDCVYGGGAPYTPPP